MQKHKKLKSDCRAEFSDFIIVETYCIASPAFSKTAFEVIQIYEILGGL
jgi:hypothetical protein